MRTVRVLMNYGYDIELLKPSLTKFTKTGDFVMIGLIWEMKSPVGNGRSTMEHIFQKAARQADNIIIDLSRTRILDEQAIKNLQKVFNVSRSVRNLWVVTKSRQIIRLSKQAEKRLPK